MTPMLAPDPNSHRLDVANLGDLLYPIARYRRAAMAMGLTVMVTAAVMAAWTAPQYEATMKVLVKRGRVDPVLTSAADTLTPDRSGVSEDELNSEVELLKSRDLLHQVVLAAGLGEPELRSFSATPASSDTRDAAMSRAILDLESRLDIGAIRKSTIIQARYRSADADEAARVLTHLAKLYIEKHLLVHGSAGAYEFFQEQTRTLAVEREEAEAQLANFNQDASTAAPQAEMENTLRTLAEFEASEERTRADMMAIERRIDVLNKQIADTPSRQTTQIHTAVDDARVRELKTVLFNLEIKQADLLRKFNDDYPPVQQVAEQITQAQTALEDAQQMPVTAETTDQNPTHQWLRDERARAATEREALVARAQGLAAAVAEFRTKAQELGGARLRQDGLERAVKTVRNNYDLYQRKLEEARIASALDRTRVANVVIAEEPNVPALPSNARRAALLLLGLVGGVISGLVVAYVLHFRTPHFQSGAEVAAYLNVPVLATLPAEVRAAS